jgi:hypothetical protein
MILIKCCTHRARDKVFTLIGRKKQLCSFSRDVGHGVFEITDVEYAKIKEYKIKAISTLKSKKDLFPCWGTK